MVAIALEVVLRIFVAFVGSYEHRRCNAMAVSHDIIALASTSGISALAITSVIMGNRYGSVLYYPIDPNRLDATVENVIPTEDLALVSANSIFPAGIMAGRSFTTAVGSLAEPTIEAKAADR